MLPRIYGESLFDDFFEDPFGFRTLYGTNGAAYGKPAKDLMKTDVRELADSFEIDMELPGFQKDEVKIDVNEGYLTVRAVKSTNQEMQETGKYIRRERCTSQCSRSFYVGAGIRSTDVAARFENGLLKMTVPKAEHNAASAASSVVIQ